MSSLKPFAASLVLVFSAAASAGEPAYQPFPKGYGYLDPAEISALQAAVAKGDNAVVRAHGWRLWAGIMQPAAGLDWPIWSTWPTTTQAFAEPAVLEAAAASGTAAATPATPPRSHMGRRGVSTLPPETPKPPDYCIPAAVIQAFPQAVIAPEDKTKCPNGGPYSISDGRHFAYNGDIMIATESLSKEALDFIRDPQQPLYKESTLDRLYSVDHPEQRVHELKAPASYLVTKHMYWPVKAKGLTALPVWHEDFGATYPNYAGYEKWKTLAAIDPSGKQVGKRAQVSYLYGLSGLKSHTQWPTITRQAKVYGLQDFYYHQVTQADWDSFNEADKAIINAASYWLSNQPFGVGDYLVTVAMHINTKEVPSWGLQSVWWSDQPDSTPYAANRPAGLQAKGPWQHYLLTEAYGIPEKGNPQRLPVATNPYIELVTHPVGTSCYTCHARAGWPTPFKGLLDKPIATRADYTNAACPDLRAPLNPQSSCLATLTLTDFQWIIPGRAVADKKAAAK